MTFTGFFNALAPEIILITGACLVLFVGPPVAGRRDPAGWFSLLVIAGAWFTAVIVGERTWNTPVAEVWSGVTCGGLVPYIRLLTLTVGALLVLANWSTPAAEERNEYVSMLLLSMSGVQL